MTPREAPVVGAAATRGRRAEPGNDGASGGGIATPASTAPRPLMSPEVTHA